MRKLMRLVAVGPSAGFHARIPRADFAGDRSAPSARTAYRERQTDLESNQDGSSDLERGAARRLRAAGRCSFCLGGRYKRSLPAAMRTLMVHVATDSGNYNAGQTDFSRGTHSSSGPALRPYKAFSRSQVNLTTFLSALVAD